MRAREYSPLQDSLPNRKQARHYRIGPWLPRMSGRLLECHFPERLWGPFPASRSQRKLIEPRGHLLAHFTQAAVTVQRSEAYCAPVKSEYGPR